MGVSEMHTKIVRVSALLLPLLVVGTVQATVIGPFTDLVSWAPTDIHTNMMVQKFSPSLGVLTQVDFVLDGWLQGTLGFENTNPNEGGTWTLRLNGDMTLEDGLGNTLAATFPFGEFTDTVGPYDGVSDFGGTSGRTQSVSGHDQDSQSYTDAPTLALFTGTTRGAAPIPEMITLPFDALGSIEVFGPSNVDTQFTSEAEAQVQVWYHYIPEPGTLVLMLVSGAVALYRRR
jgi:hypothetical protein